MRLDINLASRPYEDLGEFYRSWGVLGAITGLLTVVLAGFALSSLLGARTVGKQTAGLRRQMAVFDQQKRAAEELLDRPENRETRDRSRFLNSLIARKAFSWTQVFADLEKIIPARVRVVSIRPDLNPDNQIEVQMKVETDSRDKTIELVRRLEQSKIFRQPQVKSEAAQNASGGAHSVQFEIVALYTPHAQAPAAEPAPGGAP